MKTMNNKPEIINSYEQVIEIWANYADKSARLFHEHLSAIENHGKFIPFTESDIINPYEKNEPAPFFYHKTLEKFTQGLIGSQYGLYYATNFRLKEFLLEFHYGLKRNADGFVFNSPQVKEMAIKNLSEKMQKNIRKIL